MDQNQPSGPDAGASGVSSQPQQNQPSGPQADANQQQSTLTFGDLDDENKSYLQSQGIDPTQPLTQEAVSKLVKHNISLRKVSAQQANSGAQSQPANASGPVDQPNGTSGPTGTPSDTQQPQPKQGLDEMTAFTLASALVTQYPKLKDKLSDGSFYQEMESEGFILAKPDGSINLDGIHKYANRATKEIELAEKEEALNKPNDIPDANAGGVTSIDANTKMTTAIARNIVLKEKSNPRYAEAQKFLQDNAK